MALSRVVSEISMSNNTATFKSWSGINRGHWQWYHSIH